MRWCMFGRLKQEKHRFEVALSLVSSVRSIWDKAKQNKKYKVIKKIRFQSETKELLDLGFQTVKQTVHLGVVSLPLTQSPMSTSLPPEDPTMNQ